MCVYIYNIFNHNNRETRGYFVTAIAPFSGLISLRAKKSSFPTNRPRKSREIGERSAFSLRWQISRRTIRSDRLIQSRLSPGASTLRIRSRAPFIPLPLSPIFCAGPRDNENGGKKERNKDEEEGEEVEDEEKETRAERSPLQFRFH